MTIEYQNIEDPQPGSLLDGAIAVSRAAFDDDVSDYVLDRMKGKSNVLLTVATDNDRVVGYKIGYQENRSRFYSWMGAVHPEYRKQGIASHLMESQHTWCKEHGYKSIQTKTKNTWKNMLILNLKHGFDVIGTYTDSAGEPKIILEKRL